jgi:glycosyltransferase involved in cell wall biosynthesis
MISVIIPTYRNPKCLDYCISSAIQNQTNKNEIIVIVDGYVEESQHILDKYKDKINVLPLDENHGMQSALNLGVYNATNEWILIVNDDNVFPPKWDELLEQDAQDKLVITPNQIERNPSIFNFTTRNFGDVNSFDFSLFNQEEPKTRENTLTDDGGIFPFFMQKKYYMIVGGFDIWYPSPFICDWDFFLKLEMLNLKFTRSRKLSFYHFVSMATKNGSESKRFNSEEQIAAEMFIYKWGFPPLRHKNNLHKPPHNDIIKGIKYE